MQLLRHVKSHIQSVCFTKYTFLNTVMTFVALSLLKTLKLDIVLPLFVYQYLYFENDVPVYYF